MSMIKGLWSWILQNPQNTAMALAALFAGGKGVERIARNVTRCVARKQAQYNKERYVYDHSLGIYLKTRRKLTKRDLQMIDRLRGKGFSKSQAMIKLNLIED